MRIVFCGGAEEVGASCYLVRIDGRNVLLDAGIRMKGSDAVPDFRRIQELGGVDCILVSHAHLDHSGALPIISREYPQAPIFMTHATKELLSVLLYDSLKIMDRSEQDIPLYAEKHVQDMLDRIVCYSPQFSFSPFTREQLAVTFHHAGHVAGATMIYLQGREGSLLYTGDFSSQDQLTINGAVVPKLRPDVMLMESTYGQHLHASRQVEEDRLVATLREVWERGGKMLIPAFALGRAQEILLILKRAMAKKQLPKYPIYVDGMVRAINSVYERTPNYLRANLARKVFKGRDIFLDDCVQSVSTKQDREKICEASDPLCVVSSSGMLKGGPSAFYAQHFAGDERNYIAITGYQDEEAPGRDVLRLLEDSSCEPLLNLNDRAVVLKCQIGKYGLSAHADRGELLGLVQRVAPRKLFLVHGDKENIQRLGAYLQGEVKGQVYIPGNGEEYTFELGKPRKQLTSQTVQALDKNSPLDADGLQELGQHLFVQTGENQGYPVEELIRVWSGKDMLVRQSLEELGKLLQESPYFTPNTRRLFLFHPVDPAKIKQQDGMELNELLSYVKQLFPQNARLAKVGARREQHELVLFFHFPHSARNRYREIFDQIEEKTKWRVIIHPQPNLVELEALAHSLLPDGCVAQKFSYFPGQLSCQLTLEQGVTICQQVADEFQEKTGLQLSFRIPGQPDEEELELKDLSDLPLMEQNQAFAYIDQVFREQGVRLYKKSKKQHHATDYLELSFISPQVGNQYRQLLDRLEQDIGWNLVVNQNPNQQEIIRVVKMQCARAKITLKRNPAIHQAEAVVKISTTEPIDQDECEKLRNTTRQSTGFTLEIG